MQRHVKQEISIYATYVIAYGSYQQLSFLDISRALEISVSTIEKCYFSKDDLILTILEEISRCSTEHIFKMLELATKYENNSQEGLVLFNKAILNFFRLNPLGLAYVRIYQELKNDQRFSRFIEVIKQDWEKAIELVFKLNGANKQPKEYFNKMISNIYDAVCFNNKQKEYVTIH